MTTAAAPAATARRALRDRTRGRILDAAVVAFADQGYEGTSLARIAEQVGLSQPGLLHHFTSKRALLLAVLERRDAVDSDRFGLPGRVSGLAALDAMVDLMVHNATVPGLVQSFTVLTGESAAEHHPGREHFARRYGRIRSELSRALRAGVDRGEVRADTDCDAVAAEVFAVMDGLQVQWLHDSAAVDMVGLFRAYVARLCASLGASSAR